MHRYRAMQMVLVQQRLWARSHPRRELAPRFAAIAAASPRGSATGQRQTSPAKDADAAARGRAATDVDERVASAEADAPAPAPGATPAG